MKAKYIEDCVPYRVTAITPTEYFFNQITNWEDIIPEPEKKDLHHIKKGPYKSYHLVTYHCGFDTEFYTKIYENENKEFRAEGYMYIWQFAINDKVIYGRTWDEFKQLMQILADRCGLHHERKLRIWVANLGCEFQFIRTYLQVESIFAKKMREPLYVECTNGIIFQDCLPISGGSLASLAKDYCATKKLVGDLDYDIPRNNQTQLSRQDLDYCRNDVVILSEYDQFLVETYLKQGHDIPLTKTGLLRKSINKRFQEEFSYTGKNGKQFPTRARIDAFCKCFPKTPEDYVIISKLLFRGGYTHSNIINTGYELNDVNGVDFTSSYPAVMLHCDYPAGEFQPISIKDEADLSRLQGRAWYGEFEFTNIEATTAHSIESVSKTMEFMEWTSDGNGNFHHRSLQELHDECGFCVDNGRVVMASKMTVWLTDVDWEIYKKFYKWDSVKIKKVKWTVYGKLPNYILDVLKRYYTAKADLKKRKLDKTPEYVIAKAMVNACFGLLCQKLNTTEIKYDSTYDAWDSVEDKSEIGYYNALGVKKDDLTGELRCAKTFPKVRLLPQWGCWVTAHARKRLLDMVYEIDDDVIYCDTDSIYFINPKDHESKVEAWNDHIHSYNKHVLGLPEEFETLGDFDWLSKDNYTRFKTLGAKRYIKTGTDGHTEVTIAGLPKGTLEAAALDANKDIYDFFTDGMELSILFSKKNAHMYNDLPTDAVIDGVAMHEETSLGIYPVSFTLTLDEYYASCIDYVIEETTRDDII